MIRAGSCTSATCIYQIWNFPFILHFTVRLCVQGHSHADAGKHTLEHPQSHTPKAPQTDTLDQVSVNSFPVFLSAAQCSHGCIKSDEYECRFDFSTHLYLLAESCSLPSAVPNIRLSPRMCLIRFTDGRATCWSVALVKIPGGWLCHLLSHQAWLKHAVCVLICHLISAYLENFTVF